MLDCINFITWIIVSSISIDSIKSPSTSLCKNRFSNVNIPLFCDTERAPEIFGDSPLKQEWLQIQDAGYKGLGLFTRNFIPKASFIGSYAGELLNVKEYTRRYPTGNSTYTFLLNKDVQRRERLFLDAIDPLKSNPTRYINHDNIEPNLEVTIEEHVQKTRGRKIKTFDVRFHAVRDILPGEELSFDYGDLFKFD